MEEKKYPRNIQSQIDRAGGLEAWRGEMAERALGKTYITPEIVEKINTMYPRMTQVEISQELGIPQPTISSILKRGRDESKDTVKG